MNVLKRTVSLALTLAASCALLTPALAQTSDAIQRGHEHFLKDGCYLCHGTVGQGGVGPAIAVDLLPYPALANYVRAPSGAMPPFSEKILSDADLSDIHAYLASLPKPPAADSIKLLPKTGK
ncbi:cytochrome c [Paraburkholderia sp. IW21]|uniref:c-type cytochrome n=1 Tax=Paraburkholderia sp. IW21 TaxID=3242488 RepID=UPI00351FC639